MLLAIVGFAFALSFLILVRLWMQNRRGIGLGTILVESLIGLMAYILLAFCVEAAVVVPERGDFAPFDNLIPMLLLGLGAWLMFVRMVHWWAWRMNEI